jgi:UDP-glucose 4-epimerase
VSGIALVTGACGFIGRHVARSLAREGWTVRGIGHRRFAKAELHDWGLLAHRTSDVTLSDLIDCDVRPDLIVHCAGGSSVGSSVSHPHEDFNRTVATTAAVFEFARTHAQGATVVYPSSAAVYGAAAEIPLRESALLRPVSPHGVHKRLGEELCALYGRQFGVPAVIVRLFSVYGAGLKKQLLWDACNRVRSGDVSFFGSGQETRDWLHVEDAASLVLGVQRLASPACPTINGGSGIGVPVGELLRELFHCLGRTDVPRFTGTARPGDPEVLVADISAALATGWRPARRWRDGVREYVAWFSETVACSG